MTGTKAEALARYAHRAIDQDNIGQYEGWLAKELRINRCADCGKWHEPARAICPFCWSLNVAPQKVSGRGTIQLAILLRQGREEEGVAYPYPVVLIDLEEQEGLRVTSTVVDAAFEDMKPGTPVKLEWTERRGAPFPVFRIDETRKAEKKA
jgi:uncharacterized protein